MHYSFSLYLTFHWVRVDLAHKEAFVFSLDVGYDQLPDSVTKMTDRHSGIVRDDVRVDSLNGFRVRLDPADFVAAEMGNVTRQDSLGSKRHSLIR